jgi:hypothetical protein
MKRLARRQLVRRCFYAEAAPLASSFVESLTGVTGTGKAGQTCEPYGMGTEQNDERAHRVAAALADYCMAAEDRDALYVLTQADVHLRRWESGYDYESYHLILRIPAAILRAIAPEKQEITARLFKYVRDFDEFEPLRYIVEVMIQPLLEDRPNWQDDAKAYLRGEGVSNQGRVRSSNPAPYEHHGLLFRSKAEILLCEALLSSQVPFAPLAVFLRGDGSYSRIEPDFALLVNGRLCIIEVDGPQHRETPIEAQNRVDFLARNKAEVHRIASDDCRTPELAMRAASRALQFFKQRLV